MADREKIYRDAMNAGHSAAWDLQWDKAAEAYQRALQVKPNDYQALISLGLALFEQHRFEEALKVYGQAARVAPEEPAPWEQIARIYERRGQLQAAVHAALQAADRFMKRRETKRGIDSYLRALRLDPENLVAHSRLALIYDRLKQVDKAVEAYLAMAALLQRAGKIEEATQAVRRAMALVPNDPKPRQALVALKQGTLLPKPQRPRGGTNPLRMAKIRESGGQPETAPEQETKQTSLDPISQAQQQALTFLAEVLFEQAEEGGEESSESSNLDLFIQGMTSPRARRQQRSRILLLLGQVVDQQTQGNYAQAAEELSRAVNAGLDHPAAYFDLGFLLVSSNQPQEALRYLQKSASHPDFSLASHLLLARAFHQLGKKVEAAQHYLEALKLADMSVLPQDQAEALGQLYEPLIAQVAHDAEEETLDRIADNVEQMLSRPDWQEQVRLARERLVQEHDDSAGLLPLADMLIEAHSGRIVEALGLVHEWLERGALGAALEEAQLALMYAPTYLPLHILMADILTEQGLHEAAEEKYLTVARTYLIRGNAERAVELYRRVLELNPHHTEAHARLIDALVSQNRIEEAIAHYMEVADQHYQLAELQQAEQVYERALRLARRLPNGGLWQRQILRQLADLAEQRLDWRKAALMYEQIRTLEPQDEQIRAKLIDLHLKLARVPQAVAELDDYISYLRREGDITQALALLAELIEHHPDIGELHMRLGQLYTSLGQKGEAIKAYDTAGEKFLDEGRLEDAIQAVEAILALNPPEADAYRKVLEDLRASR